MPELKPTDSLQQSLAWRWQLIGALGYALLFALYSWPLASEFSTAFVGHAQGDANQYVWNAYNIQRQLSQGANPFYTPLQLYPEGTGLWLHTYTPVLGVLNGLLRHEILAVNVGLLLSFVLSGWGAARLAGRWLRRPVLCLLVGYVFAFSPYKLAHWPEHYHLLLTATVPFYIGTFLDAFAFAPGQLPRVRRWPALYACAALLLITLFSDYYTLAGLLFFTAGYTLWFMVAELGWGRPWPWLGLLVLAYAGHRLSIRLGQHQVPDNAGFWWGGDLAGYLVPPLGNRWLASPATDALWRSSAFLMPGTVENVTFLGYALPALALALAGQRLQAALRCWWTGQPQRALQPMPAAAGPFWALTLLFFLLTQPEMKWLGQPLWRPATSLMHYVPLLNNIRCPTRYVLLLTLLLPLATFIGLERYWGAKFWRWQRPMLLFLGVVIGLEFQVRRFPLIRSADVPRAYIAAAAMPGATVIPIPFGLLDGYRQVGRSSPAELFYQTRHHKALPGGYISRLPASTFAAFEGDDPVRYALLRAQTPDSLQAPPPMPAQTVAFLRRYQPAAFIIHPEFRHAPAHQLLRRLLQPRGYTEQVVDGYVLLRPTAFP